MAKGETAHIKPKVPKKTVRSSVFESDGIVALAAAMVIIWHGVNISDKKLSVEHRERSGKVFEALVPILLININEMQKYQRMNTYWIGSDLLQWHDALRDKMRTT